MVIATICIESGINFPCAKEIISAFDKGYIYSDNTITFTTEDIEEVAIELDEAQITFSVNQITSFDTFAESLRKLSKRLAEFTCDTTSFGEAIEKFRKVATE